MIQEIIKKANSMHMQMMFATHYKHSPPVSGANEIQHKVNKNVNMEMSVA